MSRHPNERWKWIRGYHGLYQVSDRGRIRSYLTDLNGRVLSYSPSARGYIIVALRKQGTVRGVTMHKLVLQTFDRDPSPGEVCRHLNGNAKDNRIENLRWGTVDANAADRRRHGTQIQGEQVHCAKLTDEAVAMLRELLVELNGRAPFSAIAPEFGITLSALSSIANNKSRCHSGGPDCSHLPRYHAGGGPPFAVETIRPLIDKHKQQISRLVPEKPIVVEEPDPPIPDLPGERWLPVIGYESLYAVSNLGRIQSYHRSEVGDLLSGTLNRYGYRMVTLSEDGATRTTGIHRLVLMTFVGMPNEDQECRHLNGVRDDNRLENLCWGTALANAADKVITGTQLYGEAIPSAVLTKRAVVELRERFCAAGGGIPFSTLADNFGVCTGTVHAVLSHKNWKRAGGPDCSLLPRYMPPSLGGPGGKRKFSAAEAKEIIQKYNAGVTQQELADEYETSRQTIKTLVHQKAAYADIEADVTDQRYRKGGPKFVSREEAEEIRHRYSTDPKATLKALAKEYKLAFSTINYIVLGEGRYAYFGCRVEPCGRSSKGRSFDREEAEQIRAEYSEGKLSLKKLAAKWGTTYSTIHNIVRARDRYSYFGSVVSPSTQLKRLTVEDVQCIRTQYEAQPMPFGKLGRQFGVSGPTVAHIVRGNHKLAESRDLTEASPK